VQASMSSYDQTLTDLLYRTHANCRVPRLAPLSGISSDHSWRLKVGAAVKFQHERIPGQCAARMTRASLSNKRPFRSKTSGDAVTFSNSDPIVWSIRCYNRHSDV